MTTAFRPIPNRPALRPLIRTILRPRRIFTAIATILIAISTTQARAIPQTTTTLAITAGGAPVTTVTQGNAVTLTATVTNAGVAVTVGQVNFCDATAAHCADIHLLGTSQLTSSGTATFEFIPGAGTHSYSAVFLGTQNVSASSSTKPSLVVTPFPPTVTTLASSGSAGNYALTATVISVGGTVSPTGTISFLDTTNANYLLGTAFLAAGSPITGLTFLNSSNPPTKQFSDPWAIAVADFNGDGKPDLAVTDNNNYVVTILLGNGDGTFTTKGSFPSGTDPRSIAVGDFNGDGIPDLAIGLYASTTTKVNVFLGNGDGTFGTAHSITGSFDSSSIAVGDFNGDGRADLIVGDGLNYAIVFLSGNGDGTFSADGSTKASIDPQSIAVADFNGDGKLDFAVVDYSTSVGTKGVNIFLGNGDGTFAIASSPSTGIYPYFVAAADFNGDGKPDLAVVNAGGNTLTILLGNGDGTFTAAPTLTTGAEPLSVAVADFNDDGIADLAIDNATGNTISIFYGKGDGTFSSPTVLPSSNFPRQIAAGDFLGDGLPGVAATELEGAAVGVLVPVASAQTATATVNSISPVGTGTHLAAAAYPGDANNRSSASDTVNLTAKLAIEPLTISTAPGSSIYTQQVVLTASLVPGTAQNHSAGGSVTFLNNGFNVGDAVMTGGVATLNITSLPAGTDSLSVLYTGDSNFASTTSNTLSYTITQATPSITWPTPSAITYGTPLSAAQLNASTSTPGIFVYTPASGTVLAAGTQTLSTAFTPTDTTDYKSATATVSLTVNKAPLTLTAANTARVFGAPNPAFTGTIIGAVNGDTLTESFATAATPTSIVGSYPIVPSATGANIANYAVTPTNGALTISQAGTATTFALSNSNLTLTATVAALTTGTPTGTVAFYEGQTQVGTGTLSNGTATYTATSFPAGDVVVSAQYSGDANFTQSASPPIFILAIAPVSTALTVSRSGSVSDVLNLSAAPGYAGTVQLSCLGLPAATTCTFQPASAAFTTTTSTASVTMTLQTGVLAKAIPPSWPLNNTRIAGIAAALLWMPTLLIAGSKRRQIRRTPIYRLTLLLLLACMGIAASGCGSSPSSPSAPATSAGTSTIQVVASGPASLSQTTSITLTVQ